MQSVAEYFSIDWLGGVANVPLAPRPLIAFGKRWTATGMLASDLVAKHLPTSACNDASSYLDLEIRSLIYEDEELTRLWNDVSSLPREYITRILMRYYVVSGYELGVRYERDYHDKNFKPDDEVGRYLTAADSDKVEDGLIFGYSLEYNKVILPDEFRAPDHKTLTEQLPIPVCGHLVNPIPGSAAHYHTNFDMPDGEVTMNFIYRRDIAPTPRYYPAVVTMTYLKEPAPEEHRCEQCRTIIVPE